MEEGRKEERRKRKGRENGGRKHKSKRLAILKKCRVVQYIPRHS